MKGERCKLKKVLLFMLLLFLNGCIDESRIVSCSNNQMELTYEDLEFDSVYSSHGFIVDIEYGTDCDVILSVNEDLKEYMEVEVIDGVLHLSLENNYIYSGLNLSGTIKMPYLEKVRGSGGSEISITEFSSDEFEIALSGGSKFIGALDTKNLYLSLSGASYLELEGEALDVSAALSGSSFADIKETYVNNLILALSGGSKFIVDCQNNIELSASGGSKLIVHNGEVISQDLSGGSVIERVK